MDLSNEFTLREVRNEDSFRVKELVYSVLREYGLDEDPDRTDADIKQIYSSYQENGGYFILIEKENAIVGCAGIYYISAVECELRKMYLVPAVRGKGLGKFLLEHMISRARDMGFSKIKLETAKVLREAVSMYKKYGFKDVSVCNLSCRCDQAYELDLIKL